MRKDPHKHTDEEDSFLTRWSRKKTGTGAQETPPAEASPQSNPVENESDTGQDPDNKPVLTDGDMPPLDSLNEKSDYSGFMSQGVSEQLRQIALRKLFRSAGFNIRDGLDDYDDDFTNFAALGDLVTCDMKHQIELAEKRMLEQEEENQLHQAQNMEQADEAIVEDDNENQEEQDQASAEIEPDNLEQV